ncbi:MAG: rhomboid family intramembrane serine protease [Bdellovibrionota bacterium]
MENLATKLEEPRIIANWYTRKVQPLAFMATGLMLILILGLCLIDWNSSSLNLSASRDLVFSQKQYWRLWSALFAHADLGHLFGNLLLFVPFAFLLTGYFSVSLFPMLGFLFGGVINAITLLTMPMQTQLLGISGLVNWMGSLWLTLYFLIDRRSNLRKRFAVLVFSSLVLFAPQEYKEDVSYISHVIGYGLGILTGLIYYAVHRENFLAAEVAEPVLEFDT